MSKTSHFHHYQSNILLKIIILSFSLICSIAAYSQTKTWNGIGVSGGTNNGEWGNASNWIPNGVPTSTDNVVININTNTTGTNYIFLGANRTCASLSITVANNVTAGNIYIRFTSTETGSTPRDLTVNGDINITNNANGTSGNNVTTGFYLTAANGASSGGSDLDCNGNFTSTISSSAQYANNILQFINTGNQAITTNISGNLILLNNGIASASSINGFINDNDNSGTNITVVGTTTARAVNTGNFVRFYGEATTNITFTGKATFGQAGDNGSVVFSSAAGTNNGIFNFLGSNVTLNNSPVIGEAGKYPLFHFNRAGTQTLTVNSTSQANLFSRVEIGTSNTTTLSLAGTGELSFGNTSYNANTFTVNTGDALNCGTVTLNNNSGQNATLTLTGTAALTVGGSFPTNFTTHTFSTTSTVTYNGSNAQTFRAGITYGKVVINNTGNTDPQLTYSASSATTIAGTATTLTFTNGIIDNRSAGAANPIILNDGLTVSGASANSYVSGFVRKIGNEAFTFPVGDYNGGSHGGYHPLSITAPSTASYHYTVSYNTGNTPNTSDLGTGVSVVNPTCYWTFAASNNSTNETVTITVPDETTLLPGYDIFIVGYNGTQWIKLGDAVAATGNNQVLTSYATIGLNTYSYYSVGGSPTVAGVSGATSWFRSDAGTSPTTNAAQLQTWTNQITNASFTEMTQATAGKRPLFYNTTNPINFNPRIQFDGTDDVLAGTVATNISNILSANNNELFSVWNITAQTGAGVIFQISDGTGASGTTVARLSFENGVAQFPTVASSVNNGYTVGSTGLSIINVRTTNSGGNRITSSINGNAGNTGSYTSSLAYTGASRYCIGGQSGWEGHFVAGNYTELATFNRTLTETERNQVRSYLAIKYGTTLQHNYLSTTGVTIFDTTGGYTNNIAGIGRADNSVLNQKQSKSQNSGNQIVITLGNTAIAATNTLNTNTFSANNQYLVWGNNSGSENLTTSVTTLAGVTTRMAKWWKITNTNTVGAVRLYFPVSALTKYSYSGNMPMLIRNDSASATAAATVTASGTVTIGGVSYYEFQNVTFTGTQYFTFGGAVFYYVKTSGITDISVASNWTSISSGVHTGTDIQPSNFSTLGDVFVVNRSSSVNIPAGKTFELSGNNARFIVTNTAADTAIILSAGTNAVQPGVFKVAANAIADFGDKNVVLRSNQYGTASIGEIAGTLNGSSKVTIERYMLNDVRSWHLLTAPTTGQTIYQSWQENGASNNNYGTLITNPAIHSSKTTNNTTNGWDRISTDAASNATTSIRAVSATGVMTNINNTKNTQLSSQPAWFIFIRSARPAGNYTNSLQGATTLRSTGEIRKGDQKQYLNATGLGVLYNPYPSPVSLAGKMSIGKKFYAWDPNYSSTFGAYRLFESNGLINASLTRGGSWGNNPLMPSLQIGQAIFVNNVDSISFTESDKIATPYSNVMRTTNNSSSDILPNGLIVRLETEDNNGNTTEKDMTYAHFNSSFNNNYSVNDDVVKLGNFNENLSLRRGPQYLYKEGMQQPQNGDSLYIQLWKSTARQYKLHIEVNGLSNNVTPYLKDAKLNTEIQLQNDDEYTYTFTSNEVNNNYADLNRFYIIFKANTALPVTLNTVKAYRHENNIAVEWNVKNEKAIDSYEVEKSNDAKDFTSVAKVQAVNNASGEYTYTSLDKAPAKGINYYRIKTNEKYGKLSYSKIVSVNLDENSKTTLSVYPNPVTNREVTLHFENIQKGKYDITVYTTDGKQLHATSFKIETGGSLSKTIMLPPSVNKGLYTLKINGKENYTTQIVVE